MIPVTEGTIWARKRCSTVRNARPSIVVEANSLAILSEKSQAGIDEEQLGVLHEQYLRCGIRERDDTGYMRTIDPAYEAISPRW